MWRKKIVMVCENAPEKENATVFFFFFSLMYAHFVAVDTKWKRKYLSLAGYVSQFLDMRVFVCPLEWFIDDANKADMAQYTDTHWHIVG